MAKVTSVMRKKLEDRKQKIKSKQNGMGYLVIKEGTMRVRALPVKADQEPGYEISHFFLGGDMGSIISPASVGKKCAFMEFYTENIKSKDKTKKNIASKIAPKSRFMMAVAKYADTKGKELDDRDSKKLVLMTPGLYQEAIDLFLDSDEWGDFTDPEDGYDLKLTRTGTGQFDTEYHATPCSKTRLHKSLRGKTVDTEAMIKEIIPSYEETKEKLEEYLAGYSETEDDDDDKPSKKSFGKKKLKKKSNL